MPISVDCPTCGKTLRAKDTAAGKTAKCPSCQGIIDIPALGEVYDAEEAVESSTDEAYSAGDESGLPSVPDPERRECPACGEMISVKAKKCRHCGEYLDEKLKRQSGSGRGGGSRRRGSLPVADLGKRFLGAIADSFVAILIMAPGIGLIIAANPDANQPNEGLMLAGVLAFLVGILVLFIGNIYLLATRSQSIGKYLVKTQIIDIETDEPANFVKSWVLRSFVNGLIGAIPYIGSCYGLIDILMIFGEERRCLHDQIAGTYVADIS